MVTLWSEICFVKSKVYSYLSQCSSKMTNKGVSHVVMENDVTHQDYVDCLYMNHQNYLNGGQCKTADINKYTTAHRIGYDKLDMYVYEITKLTLSNFDDKRCIDPKDGITIYPHGYWSQHMIPLN